MGAHKANINPTCWAVSGTYEGVKFDGINVNPLLEKETIVFTVSTDDGEYRTIAEVHFPAGEQTKDKFFGITKKVVAEKLMVLL